MSERVTQAIGLANARLVFSPNGTAQGQRRLSHPRAPQLQSGIEDPCELGNLSPVTLHGWSPAQAHALGPRGLLSGQLGYDWGEGFGEVGAEDEVGVADLLAPPLNLLGGLSWVNRKYGQRVRLA